MSKILIEGLFLAGAGASAAFFSETGKPSDTSTTTRLASSATNPAQTGEMVYDVAKVREILGTLGYSNIRLPDSAKPDYSVLACEGRREVQLDVNQWGEVLNITQKGVCPPETTVTQNGAQNPVPPEQDTTQDATSEGDIIDKLTGLLDGEKAPVKITEDGVKVDVPTTNVDVSKKRIQIRAPFVNIDIAR